jgi:hypothetical protein
MKNLHAQNVYFDPIIKINIIKSIYTPCIKATVLTSMNNKWTET